MTAPIDLPHLRQVRLTAFEVKTIGELVKHGGEVAWYPERVQPLTNQLVNEMMRKHLVTLETMAGGVIPVDMMIGNLAQVISIHGTRLRLRLTDQGRAVATQLESMMAAPKIEVASG